MDKHFEMTAKKQEYEMTPEDFQEALTSIGGVNVFDEPNFIVTWAMGGSDESLYRAGGEWSVEEAYFHGYRDLLKGSGEACWTLQQWHAPIEYGVPESYYVVNLDPAGSGLQILGEYPYSGRYEVLYNMRWYEHDGETLKFHMMPLSDYILNTIVPIILDAQEISIEKQRLAVADFYDQQEKARHRSQVAEVEQHMRDAALPFRGNAVSYTRQGIRNKAIDEKVLSMTRRWNELQKVASKFKKGFQTFNADPSKTTT